MYSSTAINTKQLSSVSSCETEQPPSVPSCETKQLTSVSSCETEQPPSVPSCETKQLTSVSSCETEQQPSVPSCETEQLVRVTFIMHHPCPQLPHLFERTFTLKQNITVYIALLLLAYYIIRGVEPSEDVMEELIEGIATKNPCYIDVYNQAYNLSLASNQKSIIYGRNITKMTEASNTLLIDVLEDMYDLDPKIIMYALLPNRTMP